MFKAKQSQCLLSWACDPIQGHGLVQWSFQLPSPCSSESADSANGRTVFTVVAVPSGDALVDGASLVQSASSASETASGNGAPCRSFHTGPQFSRRSKQKHCLQSGLQAVPSMSRASPHRPQRRAQVVTTRRGARMSRQHDDIERDEKADMSHRAVECLFCVVYVALHLSIWRFIGWNSSRCSACAHSWT